MFKLVQMLLIADLFHTFSHYSYTFKKKNIKFLILTLCSSV